MIHTCYFCGFNTTRKYNLKNHYNNKYPCSPRTAEETENLINDLMGHKPYLKIKELKFAISLANDEIEKLKKQIVELQLK